MLYLSEIEKLLGRFWEDCELTFSGQAVVNFEEDLSGFSKEMDSENPYLLGVMPTTAIDGDEDGLWYENQFIILVAYKLMSKDDYRSYTSRMEHCQRVVSLLVQYIQKKQPEDSLCRNLDLRGAVISPVIIQQMTGVALNLNIKKPI